jgi:hypothetical protein
VFDQGTIDSSQHIIVSNSGEGDLDWSLISEITPFNNANEINVMINAWGSYHVDANDALQYYEDNNYSIDGDGTIPMNKSYWNGGSFADFTSYVEDNEIHVIIFPSNIYFSYFSESDIIPYLTEFMEEGGNVLLDGYQDTGNTWDWIDNGEWFDSDLHHYHDTCCGNSWTNEPYSENWYIESEGVNVQDHLIQTGCDSTPRHHRTFWINVSNYLEEENFIPIVRADNYGDNYWTSFGKKIGGGSFVFEGSTSKSIFPNMR